MTDNNNEKNDAIKVLYEMWRHENNIVNQKIAIYFAIQAILIISLSSSPIPTAVAGLIVSLIWFFSIGRTIVYRIYWLERITKLLEDTGGIKLLPIIKEEKKMKKTKEKHIYRMQWFGKVPSKYVLLGTPFIGLILWLVILVIKWC